MNDKQVVVLGAGIVGISTALHLQRRGCAVTLVDKGAPGRETSYGNAGIIQREAVEPYGFPRDLASLMRVVTKRDIGVNYHLRALPEYMPTLTRYWANSAPRHYQAIADAFRTLVEHSISEHSELIEQSEAQHLIVRKGWIQAFRTPEKYEKAMESAQRVSAHGVLSQALDGAGLRLAEPALGEALVGGFTGFNLGPVLIRESWCNAMPSSSCVRADSLNAAMPVHCAKRELAGESPPSPGRSKHHRSSWRLVLGPKSC